MYRYRERDTGTIKPARTHLSDLLVFSNILMLPLKAGNSYSHQGNVNIRKCQHWHNSLRCTKKILPVTQSSKQQLTSGLKQIILGKRKFLELENVLQNPLNILRDNSLCAGT